MGMETEWYHRRSRGMVLFEKKKERRWIPGWVQCRKREERRPGQEGMASDEEKGTGCHVSTPGVSKNKELR
jgi:hypothetical protein